VKAGRDWSKWTRPTRKASGAGPCPHELVVRTWDRHGGTNLGSSRTNPFKAGQDRGDLVLGNMAALGLDALVTIGGEDTLGVSLRLHAMGVKVVGIPKDH
jgi:6-phosphofructokinase 1